MEISKRKIDGIVIFDIKGEITGEKRFTLSDDISAEIQADCAGIILNLAEVPLLDSVGLGALVAAYTAISKKNRKIVLLNANSAVHYLLVVTKLDQIFEKYDDEKEALKSFK